MDAILPQDTRVRITGNNRTKWQLVNQQGRVLTAQTLGGWHEVELDSGEGIVRVQRNALEVTHYPKRDDDVPTQGGPAASSQDTAREELEDDSGLSREEQHQHLSVAPKLHRRMKPRHHPSKTYANLARLDNSSLKRYRRAYNLPVRKDCTRDELVCAVKRHFMKIKIHNELDVIISSLRRLAAGSPSTP